MNAYSEDLRKKVVEAVIERQTVSPSTTCVTVTTASNLPSSSSSMGEQPTENSRAVVSSVVLARGAVVSSIISVFRVEAVSSSDPFWVSPPSPLQPTSKPATASAVASSTRIFVSPVPPRGKHSDRAGLTPRDETYPYRLRPFEKPSSPVGGPRSGVGTVWQEAERGTSYAGDTDRGRDRHSPTPANTTIREESGLGGAERLKQLVGAVLLALALVLGGCGGDVQEEQQDVEEEQQDVEEAKKELEQEQKEVQEEQREVQEARDEQQDEQPLDPERDKEKNEEQ